MKMRQLFLVLTLLAFGAASGGRPAGKPNFTGTWRILQSRDASTTLVVSHRGAKLEVTRERFAMGMTDVTKSLYYIDGETHFTEETNWIESSNKSREIIYHPLFIIEQREDEETRECARRETERLAEIVRSAL